MRLAVSRVPLIFINMSRFVVQGALYLCRQLRSLSIKHAQDSKGQPHGMKLMQALLASLPELRALQLKEVNNPWMIYRLSYLLARGNEA